MPTKNLEKIFEPENVAVIGATEREGSVGFLITKNLKDRNRGKTFLVNPNRDSVLGNETFSSVKKIPEPVDLGVIATPAPTVPEVVESCGIADIPALIIISAGFSETGPKGAEIEEEIEKIRREYEMRILGPNSLGIINPEKNLNASFVEQMPYSGDEVFISQSGALASSILDWAISAQFGFKAFISVGNMLDIDFGDLLDYFGRDPNTESILMYIESVKDVRKFMSAARSFARTKPILAVKSRKYLEKSKPEKSLIGSIAETDEVYEAAFKRVGITRVGSMEDLFTCSEVLAKHHPPESSRLAIVTNAGGPGAMASDTLIKRGGSLAPLSEDTIENLKEALPSRASIGNPVNLTGDARPEQYRNSVQICLNDKNVDGVLCIYAPVGTMSPETVAESIADLKETTRKPILTSWMGGDKVRKAREILRQAGFSAQFSPEQSVKDYIYLDQYARNLERLLETPEELPVNKSPPKYHLKAMIERIARNNREFLTEAESKKVLRTYGIASPEIHVVKSSKEAVKCASRIGFPVVLKVNSPDIIEKTEVGGVALNLFSKEQVREAYEKILDEAKKERPNAKIEGVTVQKMIDNDKPELFLGSKKDPEFGTVLIFGKGGPDVELYKDIAVGLPPLNQTLARRMMEETKVFELLKKSKNFSEIRKCLEEKLITLSQLVIDFPEIEEIYINPLECIKDETYALDACIKINRDLALGETEPHKHLVIEPYPKKYTEEWRLNDGTPINLRPIRPEDEPLAFELWDALSDETIRYRFFRPIDELTHEDMVRFTNIDYRREMAIVAELNENGEKKITGIGRLVIDPDADSGQLAVVVGDPWQGQGLGEKLVDSIIGIAKDKGLKSIYVTVLKNNHRMINLCEKFGFKMKETDREDEVLKGVLELA